MHWHISIAAVGCLVQDSFLGHETVPWTCHNCSCASNSSRGTLGLLLYVFPLPPPLKSQHFKVLDHGQFLLGLLREDCLPWLVFYYLILIFSSLFSVVPAIPTFVGFFLAEGAILTMPGERERYVCVYVLKIRFNYSYIGRQGENDL